MKRRDGSMRVMGGAGYKISLAIIAVLAAALLIFMLIILPAIEEEPSAERRIISIEYTESEMGVGANPDGVFVQVSYSDGYTTQVALSDMLYDGLDFTKEGRQNVSLTYGGFEQVVPIVVKSVNCILRYQGSTGGSIEGETVQSVPIGKNGNRVIARPEVGYVFKDWSDGNPNPERRDTKISASRTLTANFEKAKYTVIFKYPDGTVAKEERVTYNESPTQIPPPSDQKMQVYGYVFDRWSLPFDKVTQDMTIDPVFVKKATDVVVEVTKNNKGEPLGSLDIPKEGYYPKDKTATIRANPMQARSFAGWQIKKYDGTWVSITVADIRSFDSFKVIEIGTSGNEITFEAGQTGDSLEYYITFRPNQNTDLIEMRADFVYNVSTITFINSMSSNAGNIERTVSLPNGDAIGGNIASPDGMGIGYSFIGWFKESGNAVDPDGNELPVQAYDTFTQPTTLIARWQKIYCAVTFLKGDGNLDQRTVHVLYQDTLAAAVEEPVYKNPVPVNGIPKQFPVREHYIFLGWYLVGAGNILTDVVIDEDYKVYENINVRPKFAPVEHSLTVTINGAGRTQRRVVAEGTGFSEVPAGINAIQEIHQYFYRFTANSGYQIESIDVNGHINNYRGNVEWADIEVSYPTMNMYITVEFIPKTYVVTIQNGLDGDAGTIRFQEKEGGDMVERVSASPIINFYMEHNTSRNLYVAALNTHFVESVSIGAQNVGGIPLISSEYTIVLAPSSITEDTVITIAYRPFAYRADFTVDAHVSAAEAAYNPVTENYYPVIKSPSYGFGQSPIFLLNAAEGYYIKGLKINGKNIDLYSPDLGFSVFGIKVNGLPQQGSDDSYAIKDDRITDFILMIEGINSDYTIEPLYAPLYYDIKVSKLGRGNVDIEDLRVGYNDAIQLHAETDGGYYVKSYAINEADYEFTDILVLQTIDVTDIKEDKAIAVTFSIATYLITFDGSSGGGRYSSVRLGGGVSTPLNAGFSVEHNSSNRFTVAANVGYYITRISVNGTDKVIPDAAEEQLVQIDNVDRAYHIIINCAPKSFTVTGRVNNSGFGSVTASVVVEYNKIAVLTITYQPGYTLKSVSQGTLSEDNTKLSLFGVTENKDVTVTLEPRVYTLVSNAPVGGTISHPLTASYAEQVCVQFSAFEGFVLLKTVVNGDEFVPSQGYENYYALYTVTDDLDITAEFEPYIALPSSTVTVFQSGGTINGGAGDYAVDVAGGTLNSVLVRAPSGSYISSITGHILDGYPTQYALELDGLTAEIFVEYLRIPYALSVNAPLNGAAHLSVSDQPTSGFAPSATAFHNQYIRVSFEPDAGYTLDWLKINGIIAASYLPTNGYYTYSGADCAQSVEVAYKLIQLNINTVIEGYGVISTPNSTFAYGSELVVKIIPSVGYEIGNVTVNGITLIEAQREQVVSTQKYTVAAGSAASKADLSIRVSFVRIHLDVSIEILGNGKIAQASFNEVAYGDAFSIDITASDNNYIEAVEIDGIRLEINNSNLYDYTFNGTIQKYVAGRFRLLVTKQLQVVIYFAKNMYSVTVLPSVNGTTTANLVAESGEDASLNIKTIEHGRALQICMEAGEGYNIAGLFINSVEITGFKHDNVNANNNRLINYIYYGQNNQGVSGNLLIRVDYEINYYKFQFQTINESPNFKEFDLASSSYGTLSLLGGYTLSGNVYSGIPYGENFRLSINPVREKGYVISGITITYIDPSKTQEIIIRPQVGGAGATVLRTGTTVFFSQLMGEYASSMVGDVQLIQVRFTKEAFVFDQLVETATNTGTIMTRFYHPNDSSRAMTVGSAEASTLILVDGKFEFGLGYTVTVAPSPGHTRTEFYFLIGGVKVDRTNSVRGNSYNSIIQGDLYARVKYVVNNHPITFTYYVYDKKGDIIPNPGTGFATIRLTVGSTVYEPAGTNSITQRSDYGAQLAITLIPQEGYYIDSFVVGTQTITSIPDRNSEYTLDRLMGDGVLNITVVYKVRSFTVDFSHIGDDAKNSVVFEQVQGYPELTKVPWAEAVILKVSTDSGYDLLSLEVLRNGVWTDKKDDIQKNVLNPRTMQYRDILLIQDIRENISVRATYRRKEYTVTVVVNDLDKGAIRVDITSDFYPNYTDIDQTYSQKTEYVEEWIYDPLIDDYYWGTTEYRWDIVTMDVKHYDEPVFYIMPATGYRLQEDLSGDVPRYDTVVVALYKYVDGERVPLKDNYGNPIEYSIPVIMWQQENPDYRRFTLPAGVKVSSDLELEVNFVIKTYSVGISKTPTELPGVADSTLLVQKVNGGTSTVHNGDILLHFDNIRITLSPIYGLSLDKMRINDRVVPYSSYTCNNNNYVYIFDLQVNDALLNGKSLLNIEAQFRKNVYNVDVEIYDNKSNVLTPGKDAPTLRIEIVELITHGNTLTVTPILSEGYSVVTIIINDINYTTHIANPNSQFGIVITGDIVNSLDVHNPANNTIMLKFTTAIDLHVSSIRGFVYEIDVDGYSDIAGDTTVIYNPDDTMVVVNGVTKYEYFTDVMVTASARSTPEKTYRFAYYQEQVGSGWQTVRDGERGVTLSGDNNSIMEYQIRVDKGDNVNGDRYFRAVYYRVLTVTVTVMPEYKYVSGYSTTDNMRYMPFATVLATVGANALEDKNPLNQWIYQQAQQTGKNAYVETYIYYVDSGSFLKLTATDHDARNISAMAFYDKEDSTAYSLIANISTTGTRVLENRDIYLVARNQTMLSFDIKTIENTSGINGGSLTWSIKGFDGVNQPATIFRGSMNSAKVLDTVTITVKAAQNYRFTGLYIKNIDEERTTSEGELFFKANGAVNEWTWIDESTDLITKTIDGQGNTVFKIFVVSNMVMKFEFYRTFEVRYSADYQNKGDGIGDVTKDASSSSAPIYTKMTGGSVEYEIYDYNSQIRLVTPPTDEDYQFVGWFINGDNIYKNLQLQYPDSSLFSYWFRLYQNSPENNVYDGMELRTGGSDVYAINIVAVYQPIYKLVVVNESYFYDSDDKHWNSWVPSANVNVSLYEHFTLEQVLHGESGDREFSLPTSREIRSIFMSEYPESIMTAYNTVIPERAVKAVYDNQLPVWSSIRSMINSYADNWASRKVHTITQYYKMLLKNLNNPDQQYNNWTDNILNLDTYLSEGMALTEWQYYDWASGQYIEIPYVSGPILDKQGNIIGYTNNAKKEAYSINLTQTNFIDHTKPFVIRPKYQKKVTITLDKKAFYYYLDDSSTTGNAAQTPQIYSSPGTDTFATFNYYTRCLVIPRAASGYRFIGWYQKPYGDSSDIGMLDNTLVEKTVPGETTKAWEVHLKFGFYDPGDPSNQNFEQNQRYLHARYIKQWNMSVQMLNIAGGEFAKHDAPKLVLSMASLPTNVPNTPGAAYAATRSRYVLNSVEIGEENWKIDITIDAGVHFTINTDRTTIGNGTTVFGYNSNFDKQYDYTPFRLSAGEDTPTFNANNEVTSMTLYSCINRSLRIRYESFGQITFTNLMWYAGIRLTDIMAGYIKARFEGEFAAEAPIVIFDNADGVVDGTASFNRVPIRDINYLGTGSALTYDYVPYGYNYNDDRRIKVDSTRLTGDKAYAHFNSNNENFRKVVSINYQQYKLFGISSKTSVPGTNSNPYLIGVSVDNSGVQSTVAEARQQFRNIEVFFDSNGASCAGVTFKLMQDIHLNNVTSAAATYEQVRVAASWLPICSKDGSGFDGVLDGNNKIFRSLIVEGTEPSFTLSPSYDYQTYGFGIFSCIKNGTVKNVKLGTASIKVENILDTMGNVTGGIHNNVGYLAARIFGEDTVIQNVRVETTYSAGYEPGHNIYIRTAAVNVGVIAGSFNGATKFTSQGEVLNAAITDVLLTTNITLFGLGNIGGVVGNTSKAIVSNVRDNSGILTVTGTNYAAGGLFGIVNDSTITSCFLSAIFKVGSDSIEQAGGFAGTVTAGDIGTQISSCYVQGNSSSFVEVSRNGNGGTAAGAPIGQAGAAGGLIGYNIKSIIDNCSIRGNILLKGYSCGGIVGTNAGTVRNCVLKVSTNDFNVVIETPTLSNGAYGIIVGGNIYISQGLTNYIGVVSDCGVIGSGANVSYNATNTKLYVYPEGRASTYAPSVDALSASSTVKNSGYTSVGGIVGYNNSKVYNSYMKSAKILAVKNAPPDYFMHLGGVVGFNNLGAFTSGRGVSSCYGDGNGLVLINILYADSANGAAKTGIGGVVGGTANYSQSTDPSHFSVRYCYSINNLFRMYNAAYGSATNKENVFDGYWWFDCYRPANNETTLNVNVALVCGGATPEMSRAYYCWGATRSSDWANWNTVYGDINMRLSDSGGSHFVDGPNSQFLLATQMMPTPSSLYGKTRWDNKDNNYYGRTLLIKIASDYISHSRYTQGQPGSEIPGFNMPTYFEAFIGGVTFTEITDSRVIRTGADGKLVHTMSPDDWSPTTGAYQGSTPLAYIEATYMVANQTKYIYTF